MEDRTKLDTDILKLAYANGYFPMPDPETNEICWYNPDPRAVIPLDGFHTSRSLKRTINKGIFTHTINRSFDAVMEGCADRESTWINDAFLSAYGDLHRQGFAHSLEVWDGDELAGGIYGVALGGAFFAESKFHRKTDASKVALARLVEHLSARGFILLEVQFLIPHLARLGAVEIPSGEYHNRLKRALTLPVSFIDGSSSLTD